MQNLLPAREKLAGDRLYLRGDEETAFDLALQNRGNRSREVA